MEKNIQKKILYKDDYRMEKRVIPYRIGERKNYKSKDRVKKLYKPKGIVALYYYYKFLLGFHKKNNIQYKLTPKMREEVSKIYQFSEKIRFLCKCKLETIDNVENFKEQKFREKQDILNTRNRLYYKRSNTDDGTEKDIITKRIMLVTTELNRVKKEIKMCDEVVDNAINTKEQVRELDKKEREKQLKQKKKDKKYDR